MPCIAMALYSNTRFQYWLIFTWCMYVLSRKKMFKFTQNHMHCSLLFKLIWLKQLLCLVRIDRIWNVKFHLCKVIFVSCFIEISILLNLALIYGNSCAWPKFCWDKLITCFLGKTILSPKLVFAKLLKEIFLFLTWNAQTFRNF